MYQTSKSLLLITAFAVALCSSESFAAPIPVANASFESPALDAGGWSNDLGGWIHNPAANTTLAFVENVPGFSADGNQHLGIDQGHNVFRGTGHITQPNTVYTLRVALGNRAGQTDESNSSAYAIFSGGTSPINEQHNVTMLTGEGTFVEGPRDPATFLVLGSNAGPDAGFELIATGQVPDFANRFTKQTFFFAAPSESYQHFRVVFPTVRGGNTGQNVLATQIAEIELLGTPTDSSFKVLSISTVEDGQGGATFPITNTVWIRTKPEVTLTWQDSTDCETWTDVSTIFSQGYLTIRNDLFDPPGEKRFHRFVEP